MSRVWEHFRVECKVVPGPLPDPEFERIFLKVLASNPGPLGNLGPAFVTKLVEPDNGFAIEIPDGVVGEKREAVEGFLVAYGCGWEDGGLPPNTNRVR